MPTAVGIIADSYKTVSGFSPLSIPWHSAFWASDPSWIPPADGGAVSSWKNSGTSAANAVQATGTAQPTYRAAYTNLNGKPAVDFDGTTDYIDAQPASIAQPNHVFVVGWQDPTHGATPFILDGLGVGRHMLRLDEPTNALMFAGGAATITGGGRTGALACAALFNGASSKYRMNGTVYTVGATVGTHASSLLRLGAAHGGGAPTQAGASYYKGAIAFLGVSDIELTAQQITDLETWAKNYYGVPIP